MGRACLVRGSTACKWQAGCGSGCPSQSQMFSAPSSSNTFPDYRSFRMQKSEQCIFSVDVEDWFHILDVPSAPDISSWATLPSRVEANFRRLLDLFSEEGRHVTCFFVGWIAER